MCIRDSINQNQIEENQHQRARASSIGGAEAKRSATERVPPKVDVNTSAQHINANTVNTSFENNTINAAPTHSQRTPSRSKFEELYQESKIKSSVKETYEQIKEYLALKDCTFQPKLNNPRSVPAGERRQFMDGMKIHERLAKPKRKLTDQEIKELVE
eukprot:TRINITY_DN4555_c0_g2_i7.p1 TRINITY_DN4555_c0_g2~~TRINITY_DN4555_c0_g2_i7.p1  ORF type:complete len:158 (-),score=42.93 TRINITY_DN4555_c0_g2_i7:146-619(-)